MKGGKGVNGSVGSVDGDEGKGRCAREGEDEWEEGSYGGRVNG